MEEKNDKNLERMDLNEENGRDIKINIDSGKGYPSLLVKILVLT